MSKRSEMIRKIAEQELAEAWPQWRIVGILGNGTYGDVYKICKEELGFSSYSALKIIRSDETFKDTAVVDGAITQTMSSGAVRRVTLTSRVRGEKKHTLFSSMESQSTEN